MHGEKSTHMELMFFVLSKRKSRTGNQLKVTPASLGIHNSSQVIALYFRV